MKKKKTMTMKTTETFLSEIVDTGMNGEGVAKIEGMPVFVPFAATGDLCKIKIGRVCKNYAFAKLVKVVRPSPFRTEAVCPVYGECGGCCLQHVSFEAENEYKRDYLENVLKKGGVSFSPADTVFGSPYAYRNKLQMPFAEKDGKIVLGFFARGTHAVVGTASCSLHGDWATKLIKIVGDWSNGKLGVKKSTAYDENTGKGLLRHLVARYTDNFLSVTLVINGDKIDGAEVLYSALKKLFDCALYVSVNRKRTNVILGDGAKLVFGDERELNINGLYLSLSPMSFLQVNDEIRGRLYGAVVNAAAGSRVIYDVYSGAGIMTALLARGNPDAEIYGVEIVREAVVNADGLMFRNGLDGRVKNIRGDAAVLLPELVQKANKARKQGDKHGVTVVIDPPRKGCDQKVLDAIISSGADKVLYVSCNPSTLARDIKILSDKYDLTGAVPFNMFPRTGELETFATLTKKV